MTDRHGHPRPLADTVAALLDGGVRWLWFRDRDMEPGERARIAETVAARVRAAGATLSVGADMDLAARLGAEGVHLSGAAGPDAVAAARERLGSRALLGVSAHGLGEVEAARAAGADYATLSPVFASASKPGYGPALGSAGLRAAARLGLPILALGGLTAENAAACRAAGAAGIAVMGALMRAADPAAAARDLLAAWDAPR